MANEFDLATCPVDDLAEELMRRHRNLIVIGTTDRTVDADLMYCRSKGSLVERWGLVKLLREMFKEEWKEWREDD